MDSYRLVRWMQLKLIQVLVSFCDAIQNVRAELNVSSNSGTVSSEGAMI